MFVNSFSVYQIRKWIKKRMCHVRNMETILMKKNDEMMFHRRKVIW